MFSSVVANEKVSVGVESSRNGNDPVSRNLSTVGRTENPVTYADAVRSKKGG